VVRADDGNHKTRGIGPAAPGLSDIEIAVGTKRHAARAIESRGVDRNLLGIRARSGTCASEDECGEREDSFHLLKSGELVHG
jgi:hypothetical protein